MPIEPRVLEQLLHSLGYMESQRDHRRFELYVAGRRVAHTMTSRGGVYRTLDESILAKIAREMKITRAFLRALVDGVKTREDYLDALRRQGLL